MTISNRPDYGCTRTMREAVGPGFSFVGPSESILRTVVGGSATTSANPRTSHYS